jgi:hypothetical protein
MGKDRIGNCALYVDREPEFVKEGRKEAKDDFLSKCGQVKRTKTSKLNDQIELPGNEKDKRWRNALRTLMLIEALYFDNGRTNLECVNAVKAEYRPFPTDVLEKLITRRFNRVKRLLNQSAITTLASAATKIRNEYPNTMPPATLNALKVVFIDSTPTQDTPLYCFVWHKTDQGFKDRMKELGATDCTNPLAFTAISWDKPGDLVLPANYPPLNRGIEFPPHFTEADLIHELLHWCVDDTYEQYGWNKCHGNTDHREIVREVTTEWLTRNVTKQWNQGGYKNKFPYIARWIAEGSITAAELKNAHFLGNNAKAFADRLVQLYDADVAWNSEKEWLDNLVTTFRMHELHPDKVAKSHLPKILPRFKGIPEDKWDKLTLPISRWAHPNPWKAKIRAYQP